MQISFNKPFLTGNETKYIEQTVAAGWTAGDGMFTKKCHHFFQEKYNFHKVLLTHSCTSALEMCALLLNIQPGDEVIMPSYTFVSTANAFVLRGAKIVFADSCPHNPNIDATLLEELITPRTKAIVVVHYAGLACNMDSILAIAEKHQLKIIEDAAHSIDSYYNDRPLGSIGELASFSFHETKNIISGEGGMLAINEPNYRLRAEIIREKGTNRTAFKRGEVDRYNWIDIGSSYLPSDIIAAFLYAQLEHLDRIQQKRIAIWNNYQNRLQELENRGLVSLPEVPEYATINGHLFYLVCQDQQQRQDLIQHLRNKKILAPFHYLSLHNSPYFKDKHDGRALPYADKFTKRLLRLPLFYELKEEEQEYVIESVFDFYQNT